MPCEKNLARCVLNSYGRETVILKDGQVRRADFVAELCPGSVEAYVPHWVSCIIPRR